MAEGSTKTSNSAEAEETGLGFAGARDQSARTDEHQGTLPGTVVEQAEPLAPRRARSFDAGDLPEGMEARYLIERRRLSSEQRYFENATDTKPAFRDRGDRLVADNESRAVLRDMVDIAEHRGWDRIRVSGSEEFCHAAWREAALRGIAIDGYRPKPRELQAIERMLAEQETRTAPTAPRGTRSARDRMAKADAADGQGAGSRPAPARVSFDVGVSGRLIDLGEARYGETATGKVTPYADIVCEDGRRERAWGVGLPAALRESGIVVGDHAILRRLGTERVQMTVAILNPNTGKRDLEKREVNRNRWSVERILTADLDGGVKSLEGAAARGVPALTNNIRPHAHEVADKRPRDADAAHTRSARREFDGVDDLPAVRSSPAPKATARDSRALADRFRDATSAEAARDPELQAAQSQFVAAKAILTSILGHEPTAADRLIARSRETIARAIEQGRAISRAELRGDKTVAPDRGQPPPERTKGGHSSTEVTSLTKAPSRSRTR